MFTALFVGWGGAASAFSPQDEYSMSPDACADCHRVHTSTAFNLLKDSTLVCLVCHTGGQGADTDVSNGVFVTSTPAHGRPFGDPPYGESGATLLGGGFERIMGTANTTSRHMIGAGGIKYGSDSNELIVLQCSDCHAGHRVEDHPNQYRQLRANLPGVPYDIDVPWNGPWDDASQTTRSDPDRNYRAYTEQDFDPAAQGVQEYTRNYTTRGVDSNISVWCSGCHTRYLADPAHPQYKHDPGYDPGDSEGFRPIHRHSMEIPIVGRLIKDLTYDLTTELPLEDGTGDGRSDDDLLTCLTCHRAHGTDKTMQEDALLPAAGRGALPAGEDSMLLRRNNRGVCVSCHDMNEAF